MPRRLMGLRGIVSYFPNVLLFWAAALAASVFVEENRESVGATGLISTRPVPRYTFTRPSPPDTAEERVLRATNIVLHICVAGKKHSIFNGHSNISVKVNIMIRDKLFMNDTSPAPASWFCHMLYCNHSKKGTTTYGIFHESGAAALRK